MTAKQYKFQPSNVPKIEATFWEMLEQKIIRPSIYSWTARPRLVDEPDGSNYMRLNYQGKLACWSAALDEYDCTIEEKKTRKWLMRTIYLESTNQTA